MATIRKKTRKSGPVYEAQVRIAGGTWQSRTFGRLRDARAWAADMEANHRRAVSPSTLGDAICKYVAERLPAKSPTTVPAQRSQLAWWSSALGHLRLSDLDAAAVENARTELASGRSPSTANRYVSALSAVLSCCHREWGLCSSNPCRSIRGLREPPGVVRYLTPDETDRLLSACRASPFPGMYAAVVVSLSTGVRRGELVQARRGDFDLDAEVMYVVHRTKTGDRRGIPLSAPALSALSEYLPRSPDPPFPLYGERGCPGLLRGYVSARLAAGLADVRWHDLRHTCASYLAMSGATLLTIATILGHRGVDMVQRYAHLSPRHLRDAVDKVWTGLAQPKEGKGVVQ